MALATLGTGVGHVKAGFYGYGKSGKSYTAMLLAVAARRHTGHTGSIAMFDTENGSPYLAPAVQALTQSPLVGVRGRSFGEMMQFVDDCQTEDVAVAIIDSITHPWRELCESYLKQVNRERKARKWKPKRRLEFQHWNYLKPKWAEFTTLYLNAPMHIIICGRAGPIWEWLEDEEGNQELRQAGTKMKTEGEMAFEPSLLVEMERGTEKDGRLYRIAQVRGDRFAALDGARFEFDSSPDHQKNLDAVTAAFMPHLECLTAGAHSSVDATTETEMEVDAAGQDDWQREQKEKAILLDEIKQELLKRWPSQSAADKAHKADALAVLFSTRSWERVKASTSSQDLRDALRSLKKDSPEEDETDV